MIAECSMSQKKMYIIVLFGDSKTQLEIQFSHKELHGLSCDKLQDKLFKERGINWNDLEVYKKRGTACYNRGEEHSDWVIDFAMPILTQDRDYINKHVFVGE